MNKIKHVFSCVFFGFVLSPCVMSDPVKTIISVGTTEVNRKATLRDNIDYKTGSRFTLMHLNSKKKISYRMHSDEDLMELEPGRYCFYTMPVAQFTFFFKDTGCFDITEGETKNVGTWTLGWYVSESKSFVKVMRHTPNYEELARNLSIKKYVVAKTYLVSEKK